MKNYRLPCGCREIKIGSLEITFKCKTHRDNRIYVKLMMPPKTYELNLYTPK